MSPAERPSFPRRFQMELDPEMAIRSPVVRQGLQIWEAARGNREMPSRRDLDPVAMPGRLLSHLLLIDVEHSPRRRYRWRLIGTHVTSVMGRDATGRYWDELYPAEIAEALATGPAWAIEHRRPVRSEGVAPIDERSFLRSENIDMPLSSDGGTVDMVLVVTDFGAV